MWIVKVKERSSQIPRYLYEDTTYIFASSEFKMSKKIPNHITFVFVLFKIKFRSLKASWILLKLSNACFKTTSYDHLVQFIY